MKNKRIVTYSLLAHINNTGTLSKGLLEIFIPLAKRALSILNNEGTYSGKSIAEIQSKINELYSIDIPTPVLKLILHKISEEVNDESNNKFTLYSDGAFAIKDYVFTEFDSLIKKKEAEVSEIEDLFKQFCEISEIPRHDYGSIFTFLEKNKLLISKYLNSTSSNGNGNGKDYSLEAQFIEFFKKIPPVYERIKDLYLGTIISNYIEYSSPKINSNIELLFDTNFLISLIDLNTPESTHSCRKLIEIARHHGYQLTVLKDTIEEAERLLYRRSETFNEYYLTKKINPEDIYNACDRRKLTKTDLEKIADSLQEKLSQDFGINVLPHTDKYKNIAKFSKEFTSLKKYRNNDVAALHDATALYYVREKRNNKKYKSFDRVPCWFVNNAINNVFHDSNFDDKLKKNSYQPEIIKVDILLNILWLSNPNLNCRKESNDISETGLSCLVSSTLIASMPKNAILKELDDNINKYASEELSAEQVVRVATRIANKQIANIENLNDLAKEDKEKFVKTLQKEADKQKEIENKRIAQIENILSQLSKETEKVKKKNSSVEEIEKENESLKDQLKKSAEKQDNFEKQLVEIQQKEKLRENKDREEKKEQFIGEKIKKWRSKSWIEFIISIAVFIGAGAYLLLKADWDFNKSTESLQAVQSNFIVSSILSFLGLIFSGIVVKSLFNKYRNYSNINAYKATIKIPEEMKEKP
jgi:hypothetical protein